MSVASQEQDTGVPRVDEGDPPDVGGRRSRLARVLTDSVFVIFVVLFGMAAVFALLRPEAFATLTTVRNIAIAASGLLVIAVGMTFVIVTAGIDLSVGSVLVFSGVIAVRAMEAAGLEGWPGVAVGLLGALVAGTAWGVVNGLLVTKAGINPLIVTLGTLGAALGLAQVITGGIDLRTSSTELTRTIGTGDVLGVPWLVVIALAVAAVGEVTLRATRYGRRTYAIGSNPEAARRAGIPVDRHLITVYAMSGLLAGLAGLMSLARFTNTTIGGHGTDNLQAIAAVVIGGTSLFGGIGTVLGSVAGVLIPGVLTYGFVILRVQAFWQQVAVGVVLIAAVYIDQLKRAARERS